MTGTPEALTFHQRIALWSTAVAVALTRLLPLAKGPWDWDEVLFCMAVGEYDVGQHQPHPPGFPLYIAMARLIRGLVSSDFLALQVVNIVAAMAVFPVMFALARALRFDFVRAFWVALLFAFLPNVWFYGGTGFSDLPAMVFFLATVAAFLFAARTGSTRLYLFASVLLACGVLIRPQNAVVAVFPWAFASWVLVRDRRWGALLSGASLTALLVLLGYGASAWATGGFDAYMSALVAHGEYVKRADSVTASVRPPLYRVVQMMLDPYQAGKVSLLINLLALIGILRGVVREPRQPVREIFLTFGPFFAFAMFAVNPLGSSRFSLNWMAGIALLAVLGAEVLASVVPRARLAVLGVLLVVLLGRLIPWTLPSFEEPRKTDAPPVAAAKWVAANVPRSSTVYVDETIWPWAKYYIPQHERERPHSAMNVINDPRAATGVYLSMDPGQLKVDRSFTRPRNRTWNLVTQRAFEAYVMQTNQVVAYGHGWYGLEGNWPDVWRWSTRRATLRFPPLHEPAELKLTFEVPLDVLGKPVQVKFTMNGVLLGTHVATDLWNEVQFQVQPRSDRANELRIELSDTIVPARLGPSHDFRELGLMLRRCDWQPARIAVLRKAG